MNVNINMILIRFMIMKYTEAGKSILDEDSTHQVGYYVDILSYKIFHHDLEIVPEQDDDEEEDYYC